MIKVLLKNNINNKVRLLRDLFFIANKQATFILPEVGYIVASGGISVEEIMEQDKKLFIYWRET